MGIIAFKNELQNAHFVHLQNTEVVAMVTSDAIINASDVTMATTSSKPWPVDICSYTGKLRSPRADIVQTTY